MATKKKTATKKKHKEPHCTIRRNADGTAKKTQAGKTMKMCWKDGKLVSESVVKQHRARKKAAK